MWSIMCVLFCIWLRIQLLSFSFIFMEILTTFHVVIHKPLLRVCCKLLHNLAHVDHSRVMAQNRKCFQLIDPTLFLARLALFFRLYWPYFWPSQSYFSHNIPYFNFGQPCFVHYRFRLGLHHPSYFKTRFFDGVIIRPVNQPRLYLDLTNWLLPRYGPMARFWTNFYCITTVWWVFIVH